MRCTVRRISILLLNFLHNLPTCKQKQKYNDGDDGGGGDDDDDDDDDDDGVGGSNEGGLGSRDQPSDCHNWCQGDDEKDYIYDDDDDDN